MSKFYNVWSVRSDEELRNLESEYRREKETRYYAWDQPETPYEELTNLIWPDREGSYKSKLVFTYTCHNSRLGMDKINETFERYMRSNYDSNDIDLIVIASHVEKGYIYLKTLFRLYHGDFNIKDFYSYIGEDPDSEDCVEEVRASGTLVMPEGIHEETKEEKAEHRKLYEQQQQKLNEATEDAPFLNAIDEYIKEETSDLIHAEPIYDLKAVEDKTLTVGERKDFDFVFKEMMALVSGIEKNSYVLVMTGAKPEKEFMDYLQKYMMDNYVPKRLFREDVPTMMHKLYRSLFQLYVVQDLIDDPDVTDINITAYDVIRANIKGKGTFLSNLTFVDVNDYKRFIDGIALRYNVSFNEPTTTFTYDYDADYILRMTVSAAYVNADDWPYLHIGKTPRQKYLMDDLVKEGMMPQKVRDYIADCALNSRGIVAAGKPRSGKTVFLNALIEEYEQKENILCIQENDELFAYRKGVKFQHVVQSSDGIRKPVSLSDLGTMALVAGCTVFVIGEAKGGEICSAIRLANSGCRTALTIHAASAEEVPDKMVDLAMTGFSQDYRQTRRMLKAFQTIVYIENFKVKEIREIIGYDDKNNNLIMRPIYKLNQLPIP